VGKAQSIVGTEDQETSGLQHSSNFGERHNWRSEPWNDSERDDQLKFARSKRKGVTVRKRELNLAIHVLIAKASSRYGEHRVDSVGRNNAEPSFCQSHGRSTRPTTHFQDSRLVRELEAINPPKRQRLPTLVSGGSNGPRVVQRVPVSGL
jgi:hypothetical protein